MAIVLPRLVGFIALSVTILGSGLIFASRPLAGSGEEVREIFSKELPNVPGKALTAVQVDYAPGGASKPHHHSGVVFAYVVSGEIRSQVDSEPPHQRAGQAARRLGGGSGSRIDH